MMDLTQSNWTKALRRAGLDHGDGIGSRRSGRPLHRPGRPPGDRDGIRRSDRILGVRDGARRAHRLELHPLERPELFHQPGSDIFGFDFFVEEAGRYHFRLHNRHDHPDSTEANDVWVRMDGGAWPRSSPGSAVSGPGRPSTSSTITPKPPAEYQLDGRQPQDRALRTQPRLHDRQAAPLPRPRGQCALASHPESPREATRAPRAGILIHPASVPAGDKFRGLQCASTAVGASTPTVTRSVIGGPSAASASTEAAPRTSHDSRSA